MTIDWIIRSFCNICLYEKLNIKDTIYQRKYVSYLDLYYKLTACVMSNIYTNRTDNYFSWCEFPISSKYKCKRRHKIYHVYHLVDTIFLVWFSIIIYWIENHSFGASQYIKCFTWYRDMYNYHLRNDYHHYEFADKYKYQCHRWPRIMFYLRNIRCWPLFLENYITEKRLIYRFLCSRNLLSF